MRTVEGKLADSSLEIDEIKTVAHVPLSYPLVERLIGTIRREFLASAVLECP
jgi:hypothetical protein